MTIAQPPAGEDRTAPVLGQALTHLERVVTLPLAEHPDVYQRIHADLQHALADIDDA